MHFCWRNLWICWSTIQVGRIQAIAFQSLDGKQSYISRAVTLSPVHKNNIIDVESSLSSDDASRLGSGKAEKLEQDTGDSRTASTKVRHGVGFVYLTILATVNDFRWNPALLGLLPPFLLNCFSFSPLSCCSYLFRFSKP